MVHRLSAAWRHGAVPFLVGLALLAGCARGAVSNPSPSAYVAPDSATVYAEAVRVHDTRECQATGSTLQQTLGMPDGKSQLAKCAGSVPYEDITTRRWTGGQQALTTIDPATHQRRLAVVATIRSVHYLGGLDDQLFARHPRPVAQIDVEDGDYPKLGLTKGTNYVFVQHDSTSGGWSMYMLSADQRVWEFTDFQRTGHNGNSIDDAPPWAAAHFIWDPADEGLWVRCSVGCCTGKGPVRAL